MSARRRLRRSRTSRALGESERHNVTVSDSSAGPSRKEIENAEVVVLPPPNDSPLLQELRQMVIGHQVLSEAKKA